MSASNWDVCPMCIKRVTNIKKAFIAKYYGVIDSYLYGDILTEIDKAINHLESYSSKNHEPSAKVLQAMNEKNISVELDVFEYSPEDMLEKNRSSTTLREDWELGTDAEGNMQILYSCSCECGFHKSFAFDETKDVIKLKEEVNKDG